MEFLSISSAAKKWGISQRSLTRLCRCSRILGAKKEGNEWLIPADAPKPIDQRKKEASSPLGKVIEGKPGKERACASFKKKYGRLPPFTAFTPYRICPLGAHVDHNLGKITGFAIDKGIYIAYGPKMNGVIEVSSLQFPKRAQWHVASTPEGRQGDWADHLRGATIALNKRYPLRIGLCAVLDGELPIGGLSSSAAVILTFLYALCTLNHIYVHRKELIEIAQEAENSYVGVGCGKLDQSCELFSKKDHLLYMDLLNGSMERIPSNPKMKPFQIAIFFSGLERSLASSKYNMRVDELRSAAYELKAYAGMEYGKFKETNLREVPYEVYLQYKDKLPVNFEKRARHFYEECQRVEAGAEAWRNGDLEEFGRLIFASGKSSIENYETGSDELKTLYEILTRADGVYGGRFSGAGFKGCCFALIDPDKADSIFSFVEKEYLKAFPELTGKYSSYLCSTANGVHLTQVEANR